MQRVFFPNGGLKTRLYAKKKSQLRWRWVVGALSELAWISHRLHHTADTAT